MAAAPGALLSAVTDNRINEFVFKAVLHVLVYAYMELADYGIIKQNVDSILRVTPHQERTQEL